MSQEHKRFSTPSDEINFPRDEARILKFWKENRIFEQTLEARRNDSKGTFVFYEGPPTANGVPHNGHVLTRVMKDLFPRFQTMRGKYVPRKAGWDTHGLPVEVEVEKDLHIHGKAAIEAYGVEPFTAKCIESVFRYTREWEELTEKIGFWVDLDAYVTYHREYVESVWWALSELYKQKLLYRGHKVVWWWAQGGTALSSGEVGQGYKDVDDPSAFVAFPLLNDADSRVLIAWTTTPWTLPSNGYAAVHPEHDYVYATLGTQKVIVAAALLGDLAKKLKVESSVEKTVKGSELAGLKYRPPFDFFEKDLRDKTPYWQVITANFVTLDTGTGIVHVAPAFGADDLSAHNDLVSKLSEPVPLISAVLPDGTFVPEFAPYGGRWIKGCDKDILKELNERGLLVHHETYRHQYPFCWRASSDPLIQLARPAWYIKTTSRIGEAIANNQQITWFPEHVKEGRFGDFLRNNVDWALSRERYWGTPLPVWENTLYAEDDARRYVAVSSLEELRAKENNNVADVEKELAAAITDTNRAKHLIVHKPWIDKITFTVAGVEGTYKRVSEVIDCWFDSGCMPFAQWGFPHKPGSLEKLREAFPADFISEAIDQTRGWFYSLLMISTLLFDEKRQQELGLKAGGTYPHPYKRCVMLGHVCDKEGKKESKSSGNYTPPEVILDRVRMEFGVISTLQVEMYGGHFHTKDHKIAAGTAYIAREDMDGLDLQDGATVKLYAQNNPDKCLTLRLEGWKGLRRRVVVLSDEDRTALGLSVLSSDKVVRPVLISSQPENERVVIEDPTSPAPGADAFRWFFYASSPPWTNTRHSLGNVRALQKDFAVKLRNVVGFFTIYANIDKWHPSYESPAAVKRPLLDRWILSELASTVQGVTDDMEEYRSYEAAQKLTNFVESLSNWWVRRSRERFWAPGEGEKMADDKRSAYATLYECLLTTSKLAAPFVPFLAETIYQSIVVSVGAPGAKQSVHLEDYPTADRSLVDEALAAEMAAVRDIVSLGLQVRTASKLRVRQPLRRVDVVLSKPSLGKAMAEHVSLIAEELNVHDVKFLAQGQEVNEVRYKVKPNFRALGPRVGKKMPQVKALLEKADAAPLRDQLANTGTAKIVLDGEEIALGPEELEISVEAQDGFAAAGAKVGVVVLHAALDEELKDEGFVREVQSRLQGMRKELKLGYTDRISIQISGSDRLRRLLTEERYAGPLKSDLQADELVLVDASSLANSADVDVDGEAIRFTVKAR